MKNSLLKNLTCIALMLMSMTSNAQEHFYQYVDSVKSVKGRAMSPNGKYVVGIEYATISYGNDRETGLGSFLWDLDTDTKEWITLPDVENLEKTGSFFDVNDKGMIVGYYKDEANQITTKLDGISCTMPVNTAALWVDKKVVSLGLGTDLALEKCKHFSDGTVAKAISNDGKTIVGNYIIGGIEYPCAWTLDENGNWNYVSLPMSEENGEIGYKGSVTDVSADGRIIVGNICVKKTRSYMPAYWQDGKLHIINPKEEDTDLAGKHIVCGALSVSPNGEYIALKFKKKYFAVYAVSYQSYVRVELPEDVSSVESAKAIDNGDVMCTFNAGSFMGTGISSLNMKYIYDSKSLVDFSYLKTIYAPNTELPFSISSEENPTLAIASFSNDGLIIVGNSNEYDVNNPNRLYVGTWALRLNDGDVKVPQVPEMPQARLSDVSQVTLSWPAVNEVNYEIASYNVYENLKLIANVPVTAGLKDYEYVVENSAIGGNEYALTAVYKTADGKTLESPKSEAVEISVSGDAVTSFFEDFESGSWRKNYWTFERNIDNRNIAKAWGCLPFKGFIEFVGVTTLNKSEDPYSVSVTSRPIDAREAQNNIHFALAIRKRLYSISDGDLTRDTLSVEVSTDWGKNWKEVVAWTGQDLPDTYTFESVDITKEVTGNIYQIRFRYHGETTNSTQFLLDQISCQEEMPYTPSGLMASENNDGSRLIRWKNTYDAYELTHMCNPYGDTEGMTIGNEGKEIIGANLYDTEMLAPLDGKYLTTVTTSINWYEDETVPSVGASLMIWSGDELVREQEFSVGVFNDFFVVKLNEPLKIDASKPLKVGVKVYNYPAAQMPLLYFRTPNYVTGYSDLYSEDGGKTWSTLKEAFAGSDREEDGCGAWKISAGITDEETVDIETKLDNSLVGYNIYRDGKKINGEMIHSLQGCFLDTEDLESGIYEVRAYYISGGVSALSDSYSFVPTGIDSNIAGKNSVEYDVENNMLNITGDYNDAALWSVDGHKVMSLTDSATNLDNLPSGIYILRLNSSHGKESVKVLVK